MSENPVLDRLAEPDDAATVRGEMAALVASGEMRAAIAYAHPHALRLGDTRLHHELATVRAAAIDEARAATRPRGDWPPSLRDPFPTIDGIPEIGRDALDSATMGGAILHHGSVLVRGLIDRDEALALAADVETVFAAYDARAAGKADPRIADWIAPIDLPPASDPAMSGGWVRLGGGVFATESPPMLHRLIELYERHGLVAAIAEHLGERPVITAGKTVLRRAEPSGLADFHQDGAFLGADVRTINVWLALSDCGVDAPGLEIVDRRLPGVLETGTEGANFGWSVGRDVARRANQGRPFARPIFRAGDAMIFDQVMLHATSSGPEMCRPRYAFESWFFAPSAHPAQQVALVI